jgi:large subunit ribosomal protein L29
VTAVKTNKPLEKLRNKKVLEFKDKNVDELGRDLVSAKKELFNLRFQNATNQLDNTSRIKEVRRKIARIQTVITRKQRGLIS